MELHSHVLCARHLQETRRPVALKGNLSVRGIMANHQIIFFGKRHSFLEEIDPGHRSRRVVGIIQPQHFGTARHLRRHPLQVRQETVVLSQRHEVSLAAGKHRAHRVNGIRRVRDKGNIAGIYKAKGNMSDTLL